MIITKNPTFDIETWTLESWTERSEYSGPIELAKGEGTSKDQLNSQNKMQQDQLAQQAKIRNAILGTASIGGGTAQLGSGVMKYLTGAGEGFDPQQLGIMQSQFLDQNAAAGKQAGQSVISQLAARGGAGGALPASGDFVRSLEGLQGQIATSQSQGILGTNLANLQQALANRFNAANVAGGQAAQVGNNIGIFGQGANNALNQYVSAANSGFGATLMRGLGSGLASAATGGIGASLGGLSKMLSSTGGTVGNQNPTGAYAPGFSQNPSEGYT